MQSEPNKLYPGLLDMPKTCFLYAARSDRGILHRAVTADAVAG